MGKRAQTTLTFSVTVPQPHGAKIPDIRADIVSGIKASFEETYPELTDLIVKCHLTNKETRYA